VELRLWGGLLGAPYWAKARVRGVVVVRLGRKVMACVSSLWRVDECFFVIFWGRSIGVGGEVVVKGREAEM
jgi:hypothetical protein